MHLNSVFYPSIFMFLPATPYPIPIISFLSFICPSINYLITLS